MRSFGLSLGLFLEVLPQNSFNPKGWVGNGGVSVRYLLVLLHRAGMWEGGRETSTNASFQELLQNLTPLGTQRPPSRSDCQQTARGRGGGGVLAGPKSWIVP